MNAGTITAGSRLDMAVGPYSIRPDRDHQPLVTIGNGACQLTPLTAALMPSAVSRSPGSILSFTNTVGVPSTLRSLETWPTDSSQPW